MPKFTPNFTLFCLLLIYVLKFAQCNSTESDLSDKNRKILREILDLKNNGKKFVKKVEKLWSCDEVQIFLNKSDKSVVDCVVRIDEKRKNILWYRIDNTLTWEEAWEACRLIEGADLASIHNVDEFNNLRYLFWVPDNDHTANWVGLNDILDEDHFKYTDGTSTDYHKWSMVSNEPNGGKDENCVMYQPRVSGGGCCWSDGLHDIKCGFELPAICKLTNP